MTARIHDYPGLLARLTMGNPDKAAALATVLRGDVEGENLLGQVMKVDPTALKPQRFTVYSAADALKPQPPIEWVIDRLFSVPSVSIVFGEGGSKKTYAMLDAAVCVAAGIDWLNFPTKQSPVLFIDEESGNRRLSRRMADVLQGHMADANPPPLHYTSLARLNVCDPADVAELHSLITETGARFVVIDSWVAAARGVENENDAAQVQAVFDLLRPVAEATQAVIVLIHHANKSGGYRGSTAIKGAVDAMLSVESKADSPNIDFSFEKARDVEPFKFAATAHFGEGRFFLMPSESVQRVKPMSKAQGYVTRYLNEHGTASVKDICDHADTCSPEQARRAVYSLADMGRIERADAGGKGTQATYRLKPGCQ